MHIVGVSRVENPALWKSFQVKKETLSQCSALHPALPEFPELDQAVNEVYLWHGCHSSAADSTGAAFKINCGWQAAFSMSGRAALLVAAALYHGFRWSSRFLSWSEQGVSSAIYSSPGA